MNESEKAKPTAADEREPVSEAETPPARTNEGQLDAAHEDEMLRRLRELGYVE